MRPWMIILAVVIIALVAFGVYAWKNYKKYQEQEALIAQNKQIMTMLIIDKKIMKIKDANLPKVVMDQMPKMLRGSKMPIVKAKVGPKVMTLFADRKIFDDLPVKAEAKVEVAGMYIVGVKSVRGGVKNTQPPKKKGFFEKLRDKSQDRLAEMSKDNKASSKNGKKASK